MLRINIASLLFFIAYSLSIAQSDFPPVPNPPKLVNDFTNTLSSGEINQLEQKLVAYNDSTSTQVTIIMIRSIGPYDISDYAFQLGDLWGIGQKDKDNGVLILAAMDDRQVFIATGYGMEGAIPDILAKRIVDELIVPDFRNENYYKGLDAAADMIFKLASGEFDGDKMGTSEQNPAGSILIFLIMIFLFVILPVIKNRKDNDNHMGGKGGGLDILTTILLANLLGGGGKGKFGDFSSGRGSFGGGGGFGGFGGGSFGGGGAGGRW